MKMKPAITITTTILVSVLAAGLASAQSPSAIQTTRDKVSTVGVKGAASKDALGVRQPAASGSECQASSPVEPDRGCAGEGFFGEREANGRGEAGCGSRG